MSEIKVVFSLSWQFSVIQAKLLCRCANLKSAPAVLVFKARITRASHFGNWRISTWQSREGFHDISIIYFARAEEV